MKFIEGKFLKGGVTLFSHTPCDHGKICTFPTAFQLRCDEIATSFHQAEVTWCCPREICEGFRHNEVMTICSIPKGSWIKGNLDWWHHLVTSMTSGRNSRCSHIFEVISPDFPLYKYVYIYIENHCSFLVGRRLEVELAPTPWWSLRFWASPLCPKPDGFNWGATNFLLLT